MKIVMYADGGSRGNPGPSAAGAILFDEAGQPVARLKSYLGIATNNQAEYAAVVMGLTRAIELGATAIDIRLDSKLIVEQVSGRWKVKDEKIRAIMPRVRSLLAQIPAWRISHVRRELNRDADALVNAALDERGHVKRLTDEV